MFASHQTPWGGYWCETQYFWVFDNELKRKVLAIRYLYKPTLASYETPRVPACKMEQARPCTTMSRCRRRRKTLGRWPSVLACFNFTPSPFLLTLTLL